MQTFLAPWVCLIWGFWSLILTLYRRKYGWKIKLSTLLFAVIGIPVGIAYLCQYFWVIDVPILAQGLWSDYYTQRSKTKQLETIKTQLQNWEISQKRAEAMIKALDLY